LRALRLPFVRWFEACKYTTSYDENGLQVDIQRFQKKDAGDVFLDLPDNGPVTVYCDGEKVDTVQID